MITFIISFWVAFSLLDAGISMVVMAQEAVVGFFALVCFGAIAMSFVDRRHSTQCWGVAIFFIILAVAVGFLADNVAMVSILGAAALALGFTWMCKYHLNRMFRADNARRGGPLFSRGVRTVLYLI